MQGQWPQEQSGHCAESKRLYREGRIGGFIWGIILEQLRITTKTSVRIAGLYVEISARELSITKQECTYSTLPLFGSYNLVSILSSINCISRYVHQSMWPRIITNQSNL
jgi:hypothetical protein